MDDLLTDQLEWLLSCNLKGNRLAQHLLILTGCLADTSLPEPISRQMAALSRQVMLQEIFDSLINAFNLFSKTLPKSRVDAVASDSAGIAELSGLLVQIEDARQQLLRCEPINQAELIAWIVGQAKGRKLWSKGRR